MNTIKTELYRHVTDMYDTKIKMQEVALKY